ncbi:MAG: hypothetical protein R3268_00530, partial [Acidiferrobacterales bacterium]|nr:hypothetical protein [Acidiferrobacterales bacterium]
EMFGDLFLVRAASGVLWATTFPMRHVKSGKKITQHLIRLLLWVFVVPFLALANFARGLIGHTTYNFSLSASLTERGERLLKSFPEKVIAGLTKPVGDDAEFAFKYIVERMSEERDRRWARRLIARAQDVSSVTTAILLLVLPLVLLEGWATSSQSGKDWPSWLAKDSSFKYVRKALSTFQKTLAAHSASASVREANQEMENSLYELRVDRESASQSGDKEREGVLQEKIEMLTDLQSKLRTEVGLLVRLDSLVSDFDSFANDVDFLHRLQEDLENTPYEEEDGLAVTAGEVRELKIQLGHLIDKVFSHQNRIERELAARRAFVLIRNVLILIPFLLFYGGFFTTLRNAIVSIVEALALQEEATGASARRS